jgi:hypothetical protein
MSEKIEEGKVLLDIADVRKLLGGFGVSHKDMAHPLMAHLYEDHPAALKRVAQQVKAVIGAQAGAPHKSKCNSCGVAMFMPASFGGIAYCSDYCRLEV